MFQTQENIDKEHSIFPIEEKIIYNDSNLESNFDKYSCSDDSESVSSFSDNYDSQNEDTNYLEEIQLKDKFKPYLNNYQIQAINDRGKYKKCFINMWSGPSKTKTLTFSIFNDDKNINVIVFPSQDLINQYNKEFINNDNKIFKENFANYECLVFYSDHEYKLNIKNNKIKYTTKQNILDKFLKKTNCKKIILVTYQSFKKFINECIKVNILIDKLIWDETHHIFDEEIQHIAFNNKFLNRIVCKTEYYSATETRWKYTLSKITKYINKNKKLPSSSDEDVSIKKLGVWLKTQKEDYQKHIYIMQDPKLRNIWNDFVKNYSNYFINNTIEYITKNEKRLSLYNKVIYMRKQSLKISHQEETYQKQISIIQESEFKKLWDNFLKLIF